MTFKGNEKLGDSGGSDAESTASNSLDRKGSISNFEQMQRSRGGQGSKGDTISSSSSMMRKGKVEKILKGSLDLIPSPSAKIQIMGGKVCLRSLVNFPPMI